MISSFLSNSKILFLSRLILGGLFIYASIDKMINPLGFAQINHYYRLLPPNTINIWAVILPWIEFIAGFLLIIGIKVKPASLIINGLLIIFMAVLTITAIRGINVACGCFTTSTAVKSNLIYRILEDVGMLILGMHILIFYKDKFSKKEELV